MGEIVFDQLPQPIHHRLQVIARRGGLVGDADQAGQLQRGQPLEGFQWFPVCGRHNIVDVPMAIDQRQDIPLIRFQRDVADLSRLG